MHPLAIVTIHGNTMLIITKNGLEWLTDAPERENQNHNVNIRELVILLKDALVDVVDAGWVAGYNDAAVLAG